MSNFVLTNKIFIENVVIDRNSTKLFGQRYSKNQLSCDRTISLLSIFAVEFSRNYHWNYWLAILSAGQKIRKFIRLNSHFWLANITLIKHYLKILRKK
jgi:hypothetical protein